MSEQNSFRNEDPAAQRYGLGKGTEPFGTPAAEEFPQSGDEGPGRPWEEEPEYSTGEKLSAMMGALSASFLIGAAYVIGLGIVIILMVSFWK